MTNDQSDSGVDFKVCVIRSDARQVSLPKRAIDRELEQHHFADDAVFAVRLALEEALTNAVRHGNMNDPSKTITVRYSVNDERAVIIVRDEGCGFVPENVPDPTTPERLRVPNGRGLMLIRSYMDEVEYRDQGRELRVVKRKS